MQKIALKEGSLPEPRKDLDEEWIKKIKYIAGESFFRFRKHRIMIEIDVTTSTGETVKKEKERLPNEAEKLRLLKSFSDSELSKAWRIHRNERKKFIEGQKLMKSADRLTRLKFSETKKEMGLIQHLM